MKAALKALKTSQIVEAIKAIGGGKVDIDNMQVRASLLQEYETREGEDKADALMDEIGL